MAEHTTDQIQKLLYEKSDKQTKANVSSTLTTLNNWRNRNGGCVVRIPVSAGLIKGRDGKNLRQDDTLTSDQDVKNALGYAHLEVSLGTVLSQMEEYMFLHVQPADRLAYVQSFLDEVENLRATADELADRVQGLENQ